MAEHVIPQEPTEFGVVVRDKFGKVFVRTDRDERFPWEWRSDDGQTPMFCRWETITDRAPIEVASWTAERED